MLAGELAELLAVVADPNPVHVTGPTGFFHLTFDIVALEGGTEHAYHPVDFRVAADAGAFAGKIEHARVKVLQADVMKMAARFDKHLRCAGMKAGRPVVTGWWTTAEFLDQGSLGLVLDHDQGAWKNRRVLSVEAVVNFESGLGLDASWHIKQGS